MLKTSIQVTLMTVIALGGFLASGCISPSFGPSVGVPIPVSPYFQGKKEDEAMEARYKEMMVLDPIPAGRPHVAEDAPSDDQIIRKFHEIHNVRGNFPALYEVQHNNIRIVKEKVQDIVDPVRVIPSLGPVQVHHSHWVCKVYFTEIIHNGWPVPYTVKEEERMEVVKIDLDHCHRAGNVVPGDAG